MNLNSLLKRKDNGYEQTTEVDSIPCASPCENQLMTTKILYVMEEASRLDRGLTLNEILDLVLSRVQADECISTDASIF
jgi:hypothetical protein